jgi:uncharacterized protein YbdZ (MbtH family)
VSINRFDDDTGSFFVLVDDEQQQRLRPTFAEFPSGWRLVYSEADRAACPNSVEQNWPDIRRENLRESVWAAGALDKYEV